jgi:hypothetical protein
MTADDLFPPRPAHNAEMNSMIVAPARSGEHPTGAVARLGANSPRERLSAALDHLDDAHRSGDETAIGYAEHMLDRMIDEARASRSAQPRDPETGQFVSTGFDGGVHRVRGPSPGLTIESSRELMARAFVARRQERLEQGAKQQTIVVPNVGDANA